jgi:tRNA nucleotidyltransferase (CCA-adding enzyme)
MADYVYLLETRLTPDQKRALIATRDVARAKGMTSFLAGGAVRDMSSGSPVRDLDVTVQGNALKLRKEIEKIGGSIHGENEASQSLYVKFPGGVRMEVVSAHTVEFPKPGKAIYHPSTILEDLNQRDFTANAMALSLNEGSFGLLMDPLNGISDVETRTLRLISNYGFIEDPSRLIRVARQIARLGWDMDEKTRLRYQTAKDEDYISALTPFQRGYELEEILHEEDGLRVLKALEHEGWMKHLYPAWTTAKVNATGLRQLLDTWGQLQTQGVNPDISAASAELMTEKLSPKEISALKKMFPRQGFVEEWEALEGSAKEFAKQLSAKEMNTPSAAWKLITSANPDAVLWLAYTAPTAAIKNKFTNFFTVWPQARQKTPHLIMQEMRITPELPRYQELLDALFFAFMDNKLTTEEEIRKFLEPYSPPAPPPPVHVRRPRAAKKMDAKAPRASRAKKAAVAAAAVPAAAVPETHAAIKPVKPIKPERAAKAAAVKEPAKAAKAVAPAKKRVAPAAKKAVAKKKTVTKKVGAKKSASVKKSAAKKTVAKKAVAKPVKKTAAKKPAAKKAAPKKGAAKKPAAKKAAVKKRR